MTAQDDKFVETGEGMIVSQCAYCRHLAETPGIAACAAFPDHIPQQILSNMADHRKVWIDPATGSPGDTGVRGDRSVTFDPRPDVPAAVLDRLYAELDDLP